MNPIELSVLIPTYNRLASVIRVLEALAKQDYPPDRFEVLVIDDGSTEPVESHLNKLHFPYSLRIFTQTNKGPGAANNVGIQNAKGSIVLFLDDDIIITSDLLSQHVRCHAMRQNLVVIGLTKIHPDSPSDLLEAQKREEKEWIESGYKMPLPENATTDPNTSVGLDHLRALGGYDERFYRQMDTLELGCRLYLRGLEFVYNPKALAYHYNLKQSNDLVQESYWAGRTSVVFLEKHPWSRNDSPLNRLFRGNLLKRGLRNALWHCRKPADFLASIALKCPTLNLSWLRKMNRWILGVKISLAQFQGIADAGGDLKRIKKQLYRRVPILVYHNIGEPFGNYPAISVTSSRFAEHMQYLVDHDYHCITLDDWMNWREHGTPLPNRPVVITFDDGYESVYTKALPILKKLSLRATVFLVGDLIGQTNEWDRKKGFDSLSLLSLEQIKEMKEGGFSFQSHSRSHGSFGHLDPAHLKDELAGSKTLLEGILDTPVAFLAYPYGETSPSVMRLAKQSGYRGALFAEGGISSEKDDLHGLRRVPLGGTDSLLKFKMKLRWGETLQHSLRRWVKTWLKKDAVDPFPAAGAEQEFIKEIE